MLNHGEQASTEEILIDGKNTRVYNLAKFRTLLDSIAPEEMSSFLKKSC